MRGSDAVTFGATVGRGYNAGGAGFSFEFPFPSFVYEKETVTNYEGFVRASTLAGRLSITANIFFTDYRGLQLPFEAHPHPVNGSFWIRHAERDTKYSPK